MPIVPFSKWEPVQSHSGRMTGHYGLVLHVQVGDGDCYGEFANPSNQASSTWWVSKAGDLVQYVDSDYAAWTEAAGNFTWDSVETEGVPSEPLTNPQILTLARLYVWGHNAYGWPLVETDDVNGRGFIWHGAGGNAWGGHFGCPGDLRKAQRAAVLFLASQVLYPTAAHTPPPPEERNMIATTASGNGYWILHPDGSVWAYGDAQYKGGLNPGAPVAGGALPAGVTAISIESHPTGEGYWILSSTHQVYAFGAAAYHGAPAA